MTKNLPPSKKRMRDARRDGQFARSRILTSAAVSVGVAAGLAWSADDSALRLKGWTTSLFLGQEGRAAVALRDALVMLAHASLPVLACAMAAGLGAAMMMAGFHVEPTALKPKLDRVNFFKGLQRMLRPRALLEALKALLFIAVLAWVSAHAAQGAWATVMNAIHLSAPQGQWFLLHEVRLVGVKAVIGLVVLGGADYGLAYWLHWRELRMSRDELKREHKDSDGDPFIRQRRKALYRQLAIGGPQRGVKNATAVIVNPTHIAVALRYDVRECEAPYLVAKAREDEAADLRREAQQLGIPIVRDIPLARSLIHYDVGEEIPEDLYRAAAIVLKTAYEEGVENRA